MAEVVGLVASVVTLGEVAAKLSKLKTFWKSIQNVPQSIQNQLEELEALNAIITELEAEQDVVQNTPSGTLSLRYCKNAAKELEDLMQTLERNVKSNRRLRRSMTARIPERTASIFFDRRNEPTRNTASNTKGSPFRARENVEQDSSSSLLERQTLEWVPGSLFGGVRTSRSSHSIQNQDGLGEKVQITKVRFRLPWWLSQTVWDMLACRSTHGMTWKISSWNIRPWGSPIFRAALYGDFEKIVELISDGEASLYDCDEDGQTLLHYAVEAANFELGVKLLLLNRSILTRASNIGWPTPLICINSEFPLEALSLEYFKTILGWEDFTDYCTQLNTTEESFELGYWIWIVPGFLALLENETPQSFIDLPLDIQFYSFEWMHINTDVLNYVLSKNRTTIEGLKATLNNPRLQSLSDFISTFICRQIEWSERFPALKKSTSWQELAKDMLSDTSINSLTKPCEELIMPGVPPYSDVMTWRVMTPLTNSARSVMARLTGRHGGALGPRCTKQYEKILIRVVRLFLESASEAAIDLEEYGRRESELLVPYDSYYRNWPDFITTPSTPYLVSIKYGPRPEDWDFTWDLLVEEFAGEFWEMLENQPLHIPGAWVDDG
ncbi:ankyrin repeat protein [Metarhizium robertsii]|uniref:Ankyrin repeat protein n=1 Tax=Metarhizium robertsii TaxID=568076 RepID=A0A0A1V8Y4_9HYPO|nr:ankyrin repeat protein [Metarhizium robertsii]